MPRLSIIIPVLGDPIQLENTLVSVLENMPDDTEVVVALNQPYNDPYNLKDEVQFVLARPHSGLAGVANAALAHCSGPIVHVLHGGVEVSPNWIDSVLPLFDDPEVAVVAPLVVEKADPDRIVAAGVDYWAGGSMSRLGEGKSTVRQGKAWKAALGADVLAGFYSKAALDAIGGFDESVGDGLIAVDLAMRLRHAGLRCVFEPQCSVFADSAALPRPSAFARGYAAERFFWRWAPSHGWKGSVLKHAMVLTGTCAMCAVRPANVMELCGRALASLTPWTHRPHWRSLQEMPETTVRNGASRPHFADRADSVRQLETPSMM